MKRVVVLVMALLVMVMGISFANSGGSEETSRAKVMTILWISPEDVSDVTQTEEILYNGLVKAFEKQPVDILSYEDSQSTFREYLMENDRTPDSIGDVNGYLPKKKELQDMAAISQADYVMVVNARTTDKKEKVAWLAFSPVKYEVTVAFTTLIYSVKDGKYVYNKQVSVKENAAGSSSYERAFKKACTKYLKQLVVPELVK